MTLEQTCVFRLSWCCVYACIPVLVARLDSTLNGDTLDLVESCNSICSCLTLVDIKLAVSKCL